MHQALKTGAPKMGRQQDATIIEHTHGSSIKSLQSMEISHQLRPWQRGHTIHCIETLILAGQMHKLDWLGSQ